MENFAKMGDTLDHYKEKHGHIDLEVLNPIEQLSRECYDKFSLNWSGIWELYEKIN